MKRYIYYICACVTNEWVGCTSSTNVFRTVLISYVTTSSSFRPSPRLFHSIRHYILSAASRLPVPTERWGRSGACSCPTETMTTKTSSTPLTYVRTPHILIPTPFLTHRYSCTSTLLPCLYYPFDHWSVMILSGAYVTLYLFQLILWYCVFLSSVFSSPLVFFSSYTSGPHYQISFALCNWLRVITIIN